jgi:hypothetical protein
MTHFDTAIARKVARPISRVDLRLSERRFLFALEQLRFGRFESLKIQRGELVLDPWPTTVEAIKFGAEEASCQTPSDASEMKRQISELFEYVRAIDNGEIRILDVRHGLPFYMEIEL